MAAVADGDVASLDLQKFLCNFYYFIISNMTKCEAKYV